MKEEKLYYRAIKENLAPRGRIYGNITGRRVPARLGAAAAACIIVAGLAVACVPEARAMVLRWLRPAVRPAEYISSSENGSGPVPRIDAAIEKVDESAVTVSVAGAADGEWLAWAKKLSVTLDRILYDGEEVHVTGSLKGNTSDFAKEYIHQSGPEGTVSRPPDDMVICSAAWRLNGGKRTETLLNCLLNGSDEREEVMAKGEIPFSIDMPAGEGLKGRQELTLELLFSDAAYIRKQAGLHEPDPADELKFPAKAVLRIEGVAFDAAASIEDLPLPAPAALHGTVKVFGIEPRGDTAMAGNVKLSLEGGSFGIIRMRQKLNGTEFTLLLTLPEGWTKAQYHYVSRYMDPKFRVDGVYQGGFGGECSAYDSIRYFDAQNIGRLGLSDPPDVNDPRNIVFRVETCIMPEDWDRIRSMEIALNVEETVAYNGVPVPDGGIVTVPYKSDGWSEDTEPCVLEDCAIKVK